MSRLPDISSVAAIRLDESPQLEAWMYHFLTANNIEYLLNPSIVASPTQLRFMVSLADDQVYVPCSDELFFLIYKNHDDQRLINEYKRAWRFVVRLIVRHGLEKDEGRRVLSLCRYTFQEYLRSKLILPSRLIKRLVKIVLTQCSMLDPLTENKRTANKNVAAIIASEEYRRVLYELPVMAQDVPFTIQEMRKELDYAEMMRLMHFSTLEKLWKEPYQEGWLAQEVRTVSPSECVLGHVFGIQTKERKRILFIPDISGGFMFDIELIRALLRQGHEVILTLKEFFYFHSPTMWDREDDAVLQAALEDVYVLADAEVSKNQLLQLLREHRFLLISDGTSEQLNLCRTSVTFARAWKECDLIMAKGRRNKQVLIDSSHEFTRNIFAYWRDENGVFHTHFKRRSAHSFKFSEKKLLEFAKQIIDDMRSAKAEHKTVMFYSAVIGSIPGQTATAIRLVNTFVQHLRSKMEGTFIINPAEHFVEGMDGDDLMYMWEAVQRSGYLDVWRFQSVEDIETSFMLLGEKVPSVWSGKDSTFSTGCTKEMRIALDVQRIKPEMQIIGPAAEKFFRRAEYGVGKYYDASLTKGK